MALSQEDAHRMTIRAPAEAIGLGVPQLSSRGSLIMVSKKAGGEPRRTRLQFQFLLVPPV